MDGVAVSKPMNQKIAVSVVFVASMFISILDTTIINVAIPRIGTDFHIGEDSVDSIVIAYLVSLAVFIPVSGWLGNRIGNKRVLLGSILIFTIASILCGVSNSLGELVAFRVLQGVGGGLMTPVGTAMLFHVFPPAERVRASMILIVPTALAPALGPILGGIFVDDVNWRWVFFVNIPIGALALVFGLIYLADPRHDNPGRFDLPGFLLAGISLGAIMYGVSEGPAKGWSDPIVLVTCLVGAALLAAYVFIELRTSEPMLDLRLYKNGLFESTLNVLTLMALGFFGVIYLLALFYQNGLGLSATQSGLNVFPEAVGVMISSQLVTRYLYPTFGPRRVMAAGCLLAGSMMAVLSLVDGTTSLWVVRLVMLILGFGLAGIFIPSQAAAFTKIAPTQIGEASTLFNTQVRIGSAAGVAIAATVAAAVGMTHLRNGVVVPNLHAYHVAFLVAAAITGFGAIAALRIKDSDAAETMVKHTKKQAEPAAVLDPREAPAVG
jgi:EmrB/QacA subfamily drug resistance transporter